MPTPRYYAPQGPPGFKNQPHAGSSRMATPYRPSPISTPAISETTSETGTSQIRPTSVVQCDEESLLRTLGLSPQDIKSADHTPWDSSEAPSFAAWLTQRRAEDAHKKFRGTFNHAASTSTALDPRAGEFVPLAARLQSPPPGLGAGVLQVKHPWVSKFRAGSVTVDPNVRAQYAREIVRMGRWDARVLQDLAGKFAEGAMESSGEHLNVLAQFARAIDRAFVDFHHAVCARGFREQMMRCLWVEFDAFWNPSNPTSFLCATPKTDKPVLSPALSIVSFVAELYTSQVVHAEFVHLCLNGLVADMHVIEQLRAARVLLTRLDYHLFNENRQAMNNVIAAINKNTTRIVPGHSALGEVFDQRTVQVQVEDIIVAASRWAAPGPSERRALTKEAFADSGFTPRVFAPDGLAPPPGLTPSPHLVYTTARTVTPVRR